MGLQDDGQECAEPACTSDPGSAIWLPRPCHTHRPHGLNGLVIMSAAGWLHVPLGRVFRKQDELATSPTSLQNFIPLSPWAGDLRQAALCWRTRMAAGAAAAYDGHYTHKCVRPAGLYLLRQKSSAAGAKPRRASGPGRGACALSTGSAFSKPLLAARR